jgi:tetratricopeptide (TPR) repeat protein
MKLKYIFLIFFIPVILSAQSKQFDSLVVKGIKQIYDIKFSEAEKTFRGLIADYPSHPAGKFFLAMIDWWKILLDMDNESYDDIFFAKLEDVIFLCDEILKKDPANVDALFFKGGAIGFRGRLRANRESWIKAADDGREAIPIVQRASKLDPTNIDVQLGFGIYDYYAAVIPENYPIIKPLMIFFPKGDKEKGIKELKLVAEKGKYARIEARYFLMTLYYHYEGDNQKAYEYAKQLSDEFPDNPLFQRFLGRTLVRRGDYTSADQVFRDVYSRSIQNYPGYNSQAKRESAYYLGYYRKMIGKPDSAVTYFKECVDLSKKIDKDEESGFRINATLYLGILSDQMGNRNNAIEYYKECLDMRDYSNSHETAKRYLEKPFGK